MTSPATWTVRLSVLAAFAATVWFCGPRAAAVLAAKFGDSADQSPKVALDRVGFGERPDWLTRPMLVAVSAACSPWLSDEIGILDESAARKLRDGLMSVSWVRDVRVERAFPDRFRLHLSLRRPVLAVRSADDEPLCLVDRDAVMLPWIDCELPAVHLYREGGQPDMQVLVGGTAEDERVRAAVGIACEWRDRFAPLVGGCPRLLEVDATNLGERWIRGPDYPEVRVTLARGDGQSVVFGYGRPTTSPLPRVPITTKAEVLQKVLDRHPALEGLVAGDLRFARRWADYLQPRGPGVRDPNAPWK